MINQETLIDMYFILHTLLLIISTMAIVWGVILDYNITIIVGFIGLIISEVAYKFLI
jgi:hypothetical protein